MTRYLLGLAALNMIACGKTPGSGTDSVDTTCTECMVDSYGNEYPLGTGAVFIHATYELAEEVCQVLDLDGNVLGNTEEAIFGLEPGQFNFALGDPNMTTLDGVPYHIVNPFGLMDNGVHDEYTTGSGDVEIVAGEIAQSEVMLALAPQYHCQSHQCDWPYEGGSCSIMLGSEDQWISVNNDGVLHGSEDDSFGGQNPGTVTLINGILEVTPFDQASTVIVTAEFDSNNLSFSYVFSDNTYEVTGEVTCSLQ